MLFLHEVHRVRGAEEDAFEASWRDAWMPSLAAVGASILAWIAWSIIKRKTAALSESANTGPDHPAGPHRTAESLENCKNPTDGAQTRDTAARNWTCLVQRSFASRWPMQARQ